MSKESLNELLGFFNDQSILIVNSEGRLKELICPFKVIVLGDIGNLRKGDTESVESVKITLRIVTVFIIQGKAYYYYHFEILT